MSHTQLNEARNCSLCLQDLGAKNSLLQCGHSVCAKCNVREQYCLPACSTCQLQVLASSVREQPKTHELPKPSVEEPSKTTELPPLSAVNEQTSSVNKHPETTQLALTSTASESTKPTRTGRGRPIFRLQSRRDLDALEEEILNKRQKASTCEQHEKQKLTAFCIQCEQMVCKACCRLLHNQHKNISITAADKLFFDKINKLCDMIKEKSSDNEHRFYIISVTKKTLTEECKKFLKTITAFISSVKRQILNLKDELILNQLEDVETCGIHLLRTASETKDQYAYKLEKKRRDVERRDKELKSVLEMCEAKLQPVCLPAERVEFIKENNDHVISVINKGHAIGGNGQDVDVDQMFSSCNAGECRCSFCILGMTSFGDNVHEQYKKEVIAALAIVIKSCK